jgi:hypothetical protein
MNSKLIYIGAGLHLTPLKTFTQTKEFIFVDTMPRSQFDKSSHFEPAFYSHHFIDNLINQCYKLNFYLVDIEDLDKKYFKKILSIKQRFLWLNKVKQKFPYISPTLITFYNTNTQQTLKYYVSTNILYNMNCQLESDCKTATGLIISGYHPNIKLLNYIKRPLELYCYSQTCYNVPPDEVYDDDNIMYFLFQNLHIVDSYFSSIYVCDMEYIKNININNNSITKCNSLTEMNEIVESIRKNFKQQCLTNEETKYEDLYP